MDQTYSLAVSSRLDRLPFSRTLWHYVFLISLGGAFEVYDLFMTAYIAPGLIKSGLFVAKPPGFFSPTGVGFFVFCTFAGMFVGTMGFGFVADRIGRRSIFTFSLIWYSLATAVMAFQNSAEAVDLWRFIAAIGVGLEQVTIDTFIPELVPPQGRGRAFAFYQFVEFTIVPVVALLGWLLVPTAPLGFDGWRWVALIAAVGALGAWWLRRGLPESPRWLAQHGHQDRAERTLSHIEALVQRDTGTPLPPALPSTAIAPSTRSRFTEIFEPPYLRRTIMMSLFNFLSVIGYYGFAAWVPTLLIDKGITVTTSLQYSFIIAIANPIGPLVCMLIADRMERKWQLVTSCFGTGVFMLAFALQTNNAIIILFGVLVTMSNNWLSYAFHNYQAELFPTRMRARAVGFVYAWGRASAAVIGLVIGFILRSNGTVGVALFIAVAMVLTMLNIAILGPKTLNKSLEEISH